MSSTQVWAELKREFPLPEGHNSFHHYTTYEKYPCGHTGGALKGVCGCPGDGWKHPVRCECGEIQIWMGHCTGCKAER